MANLSLGGGDETQPNLLSGSYGTVRTGGGSFAVLTSGGYVKLTTYEKLSRGARGSNTVANPFAAEITWNVDGFDIPRPTDPETEVSNGGRG